MHIIKCHILFATFTWLFTPRDSQPQPFSAQNVTRPIKRPRHIKTSDGLICIEGVSIPGQIPSCETDEISQVEGRKSRLAFDQGQTILEWFYVGRGWEMLGKIVYEYGEIVSVTKCGVIVFVMHVKVCRHDGTNRGCKCFMRGLSRETTVKSLW